MATATQSIREIVAAQPSAAAILERFAIDPCSHAGESLRQACAELQLSVDQVLEKLEEVANSEGADDFNVSSLSLSRLIQQIVRIHHQYVRQELPRLSGMARKLAGKHSARAPELERIALLVDELRIDLFAHLEKEESVLFPYIAQMDQEPMLAGAPRACFRSVRQPVFMMVREHDAAETVVQEIRLLAQDFTPPAWACPTFVAFYAGLRAFESDLARHVHLENDILFPRAIALESNINAREVPHGCDCQS